MEKETFNYIEIDKNIDYFKNGVKEFENGNYDQAEKEFEKDKQLFFLKDKDHSLYYKEIGNPYLAFMHYYGVGKKVDYKKAWKESHFIHNDFGRGGDYWVEHISSDIISKFLVAKMFYNGIYVEKNIDTAFKLFKSIADRWKIEEEIEKSHLFKIILEEYKDIDAQYVLALIYFYKAKYKKDKEYIENAQKILQKLETNHKHILFQDLEKQIQELKEELK